ncbi:MAG: MaoC family dehydratase N-terminal domain-containing protein [Thermoleophilaceae bacterium]|nr:MaoC family dehydratase N-terminal domain-containing protein [Thermoleophilaceae bacterium]
MPGALDNGWDELRIGDEQTTTGRTVTEADIVAFGALTGDLNPLHLDREWAARSQFGERVAHGMLVLAYAFGLVPLSAEHVLAVRRLQDVSFARPVRIGDTIRVRCRVRELKPVDDSLGLVTAGWEVVNQSDELAIRAVVELLWRRS